MPGYGTPLGLTLPTPSVDTEAVAASKLNTALSAIIARLESKVAATDLDIASDVSFKSGAVYSGARDLQRAAFQSQTGALTAVSNPNTVYVLNGDLHYIDQAGNLVQITASGAVNVSTTGGVTGAGYGTGGVEVNWDSVNTRYRMRSGAGVDSFADVQCADLILNDASGNNIRFQAPAIGSDYTATLPTGLPGSTSLLQWTSAGLMSSTTAPTLTGLTVNGAATVTGTVTTGTLNPISLVTTGGGIQAVSGQNVRISGTGKYARGSKFRFISPSAGAIPTGSPGGIFLDDGRWIAQNASDNLAVPLEVQEDEQLLEVRVRVNPATTAVMDVTVRRMNSDGSTTVLGSGSSSGSATQTVSVTGLSETITSASMVSYCVEIEAGATADEALSVALETNVP